jgi:long-chain fatty acid transport protein
MNPIRRVRWLVWLACLAPVAAHAAGYGIYEQGAAALGMAGAYVASAHDATAQFYNPAAMTRLEGRQFSFGGTWLSTRTSFAGVAPSPGYGVSEEMKTGNFFPPTVYWTNHLGARWAYGVGFNAPFGLGIEWKDPATFTGRERVTKADLRTMDGSFNLAWALSDGLSLSGGANARFAKVELHQIGTIISTGGDPINVIDATLESNYKSGYGWHAALLATPKDDWRIGAVFRSKVKVKIDDGRATFTQIPTGSASLDAVVAAQLPPSQGVKTTLVFPASFSLGIAWNALPGWTYEIDGIWNQWSAFQSLPLTFETTTALNTDIIEDYNNQFAVRVGAEHRLDSWTYRLGYYFDAAAAPPESVTPLLPDANRHGATLGFGTTRGHWTLDAYNLFLFVEKRSTEGRERDGYDGTYKSYVNALGATLAYHW